MTTNPKAVCRNCLRLNWVDSHSEDSACCTALPSWDSVHVEDWGTHYCGMGVWEVLISGCIPPRQRKLWHEIAEDDEIVERGEE